MKIPRLFVFIIAGILLLSLASAAIAIPRSVNGKIGPSLAAELSNKADNYVLPDLIVMLRDSRGGLPGNLDIAENLRDKYNSKVIDYIEDAAILKGVTKGELNIILAEKSIISAEIALIGQPMLVESVQIINVTSAWDQNIDSNPLDGTGQVIGIGDTGVWFDHPDLTAKNIYGTNLDCTTPAGCINSAPELNDLSGHGTHVAGILAADGDTVKGVAKGAKLISFRLFSSSECSTGECLAPDIYLDIRRAINWTLMHPEYGISVISFSVGTTATFTSPCDGAGSIPTSLKNIIANATAQNISLVFASGNNFNQSVNGSTNSISAPACLNNAISVSAINKDGTRAAYANYDSKTKLFGVGTGVTSTCIPSQGPSGYCGKSGTSMATPMVSGSIAIINQILKAKNENMTPKQIETFLNNNGAPVIGLPSNYTKINVYKAVTALDTIAPELEINSPRQGSNFNSNIVTVSYTASDEISGLETCSYILNNGASQNTPCGQDVVLTGAEGSNNLAVKATDNAGNYLQKALAFNIDSTGPQITINSPTQDQQLTSTEVSVSYQITDSSGLESCSYVLNSDDPTNVNCNDPISFTAVQGQNTLTLNSIDILGNANEASVSFSVDSVIPEVSISAPLNNELFSNNQVEIVHSESDGGSGIASCFRSLNGENAVTISCNTPVMISASEGANNLVISVVDNFGNSNQATIDFNVDTTDPTLNIINPVDNLISTSNQVGVSFSTADAGSGLESCSYILNGGDENMINCNEDFSVQGLEEENSLSITAKDLAGNQYTEEVSFVVDTITPEVQIASPIDGDIFPLTQVEITHSASDSGTGLASCYYVLNDGEQTQVECNQPFILQAADGNNLVALFATDLAGNVQSTSVSFMVDRVNPEIEVISPVEGYSTNTPLITAIYVASDEDSGLQECSYTLNAESSVSVECNMEIELQIQEGQNQLIISAMDRAGNTGNSQVNFALDITAPTITINSPNEGLSGSLSQVLQYSIDDENAQCFYSLNNGEATATNCGEEVSFEAQEGENTISVTAVDQLGNENTESVVFNVDSIAPQVQIASPIDGEALSLAEVEVIHFESDSGSGLETCSYSLNSQSPIETPCNTELEIQGQEGSNELIVTAIDNAGNTGTATTNFVVDTIAPAIVITSPSPGLSNSLNQVLQYSVDDLDAQCFYSLNGPDLIETNCNEDVSFKAQEGENTISVIAIDLLGNQEEESVTFEVVILPGVPGDLNGDGVVGEADLALLLEQWGRCPVEGDCPADFNGDGVVDKKDYNLLLDVYWTIYCTGDDLNDPECSKPGQVALD